MAERINPYGNFNFIVERDGSVLGGFSEVSGLDSESTPIEYREGGDMTNAMRQIPGVEKYPPVQLKRGITGDKSLWNWRAAVLSRADFRSDVVIKLLSWTGDDAEIVMKWKLFKAWPTKLTGPTLTAKGNDIAIEQVDLIHERLIVVE